MSVVLLSLLAFSIGVEMLSIPRNVRSVSEKSFEEKLEEGYQLLKDKPNVNETKNLILELHKLEKEIEEQLPSPEGHDPEVEDVVPASGDSIEETNQKRNIAITLYQGDIILTKEQAEEILDNIKESHGKRNKRQAYRNKYHNSTWPDGVYYYFYSNATIGTRRVFQIAAEQWQSDTCINFYENETTSDRIVVFEDIGCYSEIGRIGGEQGLSLGEECSSVRSAAHEIGHALGFHHTQARPDRDLTYDYGSIVLCTTEQEDKCEKETSANCENGGFPYPRNCSKCICPSGYAGRLCHRRPNGCGGTLTAASFFSTLRSEVGKGIGIIRDKFSKCHYWIMAPPGSKIEVQLLSTKKVVKQEGCINAGVEIKRRSDKRLTGYRFCSPKHHGIKLVSAHNIVPIITYSNVYSVTFILRYRIALSELSEISEVASQPESDTRCKDSSLCSELQEFDFCNPSKHSEKIRKEICPQSCGFCPSSITS